MKKISGFLTTLLVVLIFASPISAQNHDTLLYEESYTEIDTLKNEANETKGGLKDAMSVPLEEKCKVVNNNLIVRKNFYLKMLDAHLLWFNLIKQDLLSVLGINSGLSNNIIGDIAGFENRLTNFIGEIEEISDSLVTIIDDATNDDCNTQEFKDGIDVLKIRVRNLRGKVYSTHNLINNEIKVLFTELT